MAENEAPVLSDELDSTVSKQTSMFHACLVGYLWSGGGGKSTGQEMRGPGEEDPLPEYLLLLPLTWLFSSHPEILLPYIFQ